MAFILHLLLLFLHFSFSSAVPLFNSCGGVNYTANSTYQSNLNQLLSFFTSLNSSFSTHANGSNPHTAYGLTLCRGDISPSDCRICVQNAVQDVLSLCPTSKQATVWYDNCELRYSNVRFFSLVDDSNPPILINVQDVTDRPESFIQLLGIVWDQTMFQAAYNSSLFFATATVVNGNDLKVHGLAQCTRDLSNDSCSECLRQIHDVYRLQYTGLEARQGGRVLGKSCNFRYEIYPFYQGNPTILLNLTAPPAPSPLAIPPPPAPSPLVIPPPPALSTGNKNISVGGKVLMIVAPTAVATVFILILLFICFWRRRSARKFSRKEKLLEVSAVESLLFDLSTVKSATANFSEVNKLGQGGFGSVYKGILPDGQEIAVKRLSTNSRQGIEELKNELVLVAKLQHKNLVRLHGVCLDEEEKLLVYEYVPNRSLDTFLFDTVKRKELNWEARFKIIRGIAQGLFYLHEECHLKVIHRDLKASNILLDTNMNPKISDFGLSRLFGGEETQYTTNRVVGTFGYMAPEYAMRGQFSIKSDVYSYGVLVLEIVTGRKRNSFHDHEHYDDLLSYTWEHWTNGRTLKIIDPLCCDVPANEVLTCIRIGLLCTQEVPTERPLMSLILRMLNSSSVALPDPSQPRFCAEMDKLVLCSTSEASYSELEPR